MNEKILKLKVLEWQATVTKRARETVEQKAKDLQGKLGETKIKLAKAASLVGACDK